MKAAYVFINRWMDKKDVAHIYNGTLLSHKIQLNFATCSNMDGLGGHCTEWKSQSEKDKYCIYHWYVESIKYNKPVNNTERGKLTDKENYWLPVGRGYQWGGTIQWGVGGSYYGII